MGDQLFRCRPGGLTGARRRDLVGTALWLRAARLSRILHRKAGGHPAHGLERRTPVNAFRERYEPSTPSNQSSREHASPPEPPSSSERARVTFAEPAAPRPRLGPLAGCARLGDRGPYRDNLPPAAPPIHLPPTNLELRAPCRRTT
jgi:hypothetical protein